MKDDVTPIRRQYLRIKKQCPHAIVLFRLGDFYETFDDDARIASKELEIVLTSREMGKGNKIPLAGIPYHALDSYLAKLINRGYKVAIVEQMTKPGEVKGLGQREVLRLLPPSGADIEGLGVGGTVTRLDDFLFGLETAHRALLEHFGVASLEGYGCA